MKFQVTSKVKTKQELIWKKLSNENCQKFTSPETL